MQWAETAETSLAHHRRTLSTAAAAGMNEGPGLAYRVAGGYGFAVGLLARRIVTR